MTLSYSQNNYGANVFKIMQLMPQTIFHPYHAHGEVKKIIIDKHDVIFMKHELKGFKKVNFGNV